MAERVLRMGVALLVGVYVARYLGPERFGLLSYATSFVGLFTALATLGLEGIVVRELVKGPDRSDEILGTAFVLKLTGALLMWGCIAIGVQFTTNDGFTNLLIAIIAFGVLFQSFNVIDFHFQASVRSKYAVRAQVGQLIISSIVKIALVWMKASLLWFAMASVLDAICLATGLTWIYYLKSGRILAWRWRWRWEGAKNLLKDSWPLIFSGLAISIYMKIDQVMIKEMLGAEQVGLYAAAVKLSEAWYFVPMAITSSVFPAIINAKKQSEELYYQRLQKLYDLMVWLAVAIALPTTFLAPWVIGVLYGEAFLLAAGVLSIHVWAGVFVFLGVASGKWLLTENLQIFFAINTSIGAIINIILNYILIKNVGVKGAAISTLISYFIAAYLSLSFFYKTRMNFINLTKSLFLKGLFSAKANS